MTAESIIVGLMSGYILFDAVIFHIYPWWKYGTHGYTSFVHVSPEERDGAIRICQTLRETNHPKHRYFINGKRVKFPEKEAGD